MKNLNKLLVLLAFIGLSMSAMAQNTYTITRKGNVAHVYFVYFNGVNLFGGATAAEIQRCIDTIKVEAAGAPCIIQLGNNTSELVLPDGTETIITFENSATKTWGEITLTGNATTACTASDGIIMIGTGVTLKCQTEKIKSTSSAKVPLIYNEGSLTINDGTLDATGGGDAIHNFGTVFIESGQVYTNTGTIIENNGELYISKGAILTYYGTAIENRSTLEISGGMIGSTVGLAINSEDAYVHISGGSVSAPGGAISGSGTIEISGGTVGAYGNSPAITISPAYEAGILKISGGEISVTTNNNAIENYHSNVTVTGGEISATTGNAIVTYDEGTVNITDGKVSATTGKAIYINEGEVTISGGTVSATSGTAISNDFGTVNINGGEVLATEGNAVSSNSGPIIIKGGKIWTTTGYAVASEYAEISISGGIISATTGLAVFNNESTTTFSGGILFAYGTEDSHVIDSRNFVQTDKAVIVAWNESAGIREYAANTANEIYKNPDAATALWTKQSGKSGIAVEFGTTTGFIPVEEVTVTGVGINTISNGKITVYPNPTTGELKIENGELKIDNVEIFDLTGKTLFTIHYSLFTNSIDISHLTNGVYFLKIATKKGIITSKIIKN